MKISLNHQIEEAKRAIKELADEVPRVKFRRGELEFRLERRKATLKTLEWLAENEEKIKATLGKGHT